MMPEPGTHPVEGDHLREPVWIEIRKVLMQHWDPIGVRDEPFAADEYDSYIPKIISILRRGASAEELIDYLDEIETRRMGFDSQRERGRNAAERLLPLSAGLAPQ
jgi:hypothetical protein